MGFFERLEARCRAIDSLLCVGLDPHWDELPEPSAAAAKAFCLRLIEATAGEAAAFKPNSAFFEVYGAAGLQALQEVIAAVPEGIPVVLDAKRGDIGSTARAYARAAFETLGADAVTVSPYLGGEALAPFLTDADKGVFVLCKTSNPRAGELQDLPIGGWPLHLEVAYRAASWSEHNNVGLVVGATYPAELYAIRSAAPDLWILAPGIGAQGGDPAAVVAAGLRDDGLGLLVPVSRAISQAGDPGQAVAGLRAALNAARAQGSHRPTTLAHAGLVEDLLHLGCVQFGDFTLKSGQQSPIYLDLRRLVGDATTMQRAAAAYTRVLQGLRFDRLAALPYAALPLGAAIAMQGGWPLVYPRKEVKDYGTGAAVEGPYTAGETVVVIDDLVTTGASKFEGIEKLQAAGLRVEDVVVLIDRQAQGADVFAAHGLRLHAVLSLPELLAHWLQQGDIDAEQYQTVREYLAQ